MPLAGASRNYSQWWTYAHLVSPVQITSLRIRTDISSSDYFPHDITTSDIITRDITSTGTIPHDITSCCLVPRDITSSGIILSWYHKIRHHSSWYHMFWYHPWRRNCDVEWRQIWSVFLWITRSDILISGILSVTCFYCDWSYYFFMYYWHIVSTGFKSSNISIL